MHECNRIIEVKLNLFIYLFLFHVLIDLHKCLIYHNDKLYLSPLLSDQLVVTNLNPLLYNYNI